MKFIMIPVFLAVTEGFITYDQGENDQFNYQIGFDCSILSTTIANITFAGTFDSPPEVIIAITQTAMRVYSGVFAKIDIISITTACMSLYLVQKIFKFRFHVRTFNNLYAVNDNRIRILHPPIQTNLVDGSIFTHSHNLLKATKAIVIMDSLKHQGRPLNFYLEVYQVTSTDVQIKLHNFSSKLVELGYSIVLGTEEAFELSDLIITSDSNYTASTPQLNLGMLFLSINGFYWNNTEPIRLYTFYQSSLSNFQYQVGTCKQNSYTLDSSSYINSIRFQEVQFFEQILFPMYIYSYRVTKKYERYISNAIKIQILELNKQFVSFGDYNVQIPEQMNKITIQIELKFMPNERLFGQFLKCNECGTKNVYKIDQNYLCANNFIRYRLLLRQYSIYTQDLIISIGLSTVNIKQTINQVVKEYEIVQLQFINQQL